MSRAIVVLHSNPAEGVAEVLRGRPGVTCVHLDEISAHWAMGEGHAPTNIAYPEAVLALFTDAYVIKRVFDFNHCEAGRRLQAADLHGLCGYIALSPLLERSNTLAHEREPPWCASTTKETSNYSFRVGMWRWINRCTSTSPTGRARHLPAKWASCCSTSARVLRRSSVLSVRTWPTPRADSHQSKQSEKSTATDVPVRASM